MQSMASLRTQKRAMMTVRKRIATIAPVMKVPTQTWALEMIFTMPLLLKSSRMTRASSSTTTSTA